MWPETDGTLRKGFSFPDFATALAFVNEVGILAERAGHHPDISLSWGRVVITLSTHDAGGVTEKDRRLADAIDRLPKPT